MGAVWYNLGTLYESCRQIPDAKDAYQHAIELEPERHCIVERMRGIKRLQENPNLVLDENSHLPPYLDPVVLPCLDRMMMQNVRSSS